MMQHLFISSVNNRTSSRPRWRLWEHLAVMLLVFSIMTGCSGGGSNETSPPCDGQRVNDFMNDQVAETIMGLTFTFVDGRGFQDTLAGVMLTTTIDAFTNPTLTITLATADHLAGGETVLVPCNPLSDPACLFDVTITDSTFPSGEGPQVSDVLVLRDWRLVARLDNRTNRITATLIVEDAMGMAIQSEPLDLAPSELCPIIGTCP